MLTNLPRGMTTVGCRWVYTVKYNADGFIERYKARLVTKGYTQTFCIDYQETFAPVAKMNSVRVLISLAVNEGWLLLQFNVKNAFLHGELEEVYMDIPLGFKIQDVQENVCKLKKVLYGLKQSPRAWFEKFRAAMIKNEYKQCQADHTFFIKQQDTKETALIVYVDDIMVTGSDCEEITRLKNNLLREFEIKDLGTLKYFLGIEFARSTQGVFLCQRKYVFDLLKDSGLMGYKPCATPIETNHKLKKDGNERLLYWKIPETRGKAGLSFVNQT